MSKRIHDNKPRQPETKPASLSDLVQPQHQGKQCPKCNYVRKPSDSTPHWQCPSCMVVYYKVSAEYAAEQQQRAKHQEQRLAEIRARRNSRKKSDLAGFAVLIGVMLAAAGLGSSCGGCNCVASVPPNLWLIGGGLAAMAGGFISWLGSKVSYLHLPNKKPEK
jgi:ribosomal protein L37AE/L43A